jgi:class 3 adenylate cyclase
LGFKTGIAFNLGNIGTIYAQKGQIDNAESNLSEAIQMLEELGDSYAISSYLLYLSDIYFEKGNTQAALNCANRSLELARELGFKNEIRDANLKLSEIYEQLGDQTEYIKYYKDYVAYRDTINNIETIQEMKNLEVAQKQAEVDLLQKESEISELRVKRQKFIIYTSIALLAMVALMAFNDYRRYRYVRNAKRLIEIEKNRSDDLLLNILPRETARELKDHGKVKARKIESATVMFTDFVEFTRLSEHEDAELMVESIDEYFKKFDEISTRYNLEKIKTIGDSYMCAGGLHSKDDSQAREVVMAAKEMIQTVKQASNSADDLIHFDIRIGIHTGPVVAGIVGTKKWQFDIWGDTVNIASRMETKSEKGRINLSETTKNDIKDEFPCEYRGEIEVKNRGKLKMYFIS